MSITSVVGLAAGKIGELLVEEAKLLYGVEDQVRSLQEELTMMNSFLIDMEAMDEEGGDERSRTTIKQIRKIAYEAEDVIESYILEASSSADKKEEFFKRRTLVPFPQKSRYLSSLAYECYTFENRQSLSLQSIHENFKLLRVLILSQIETSDKTLPEGIGSLVHLRYLRLRRTNITKLPSSIGNLRNLLTLDYRNVEIGPTEEVRIPDVFWKIKGLRHLYLYVYKRGPPTCTIMETFKLHTLQKLEKLNVRVQGSWMLKELPLLSSSVQKLRITEIKSEEQLEAAFQCPSIRSDSLHSLCLAWDIELEAVKLENILQPITHCRHLRKLLLLGKIGDRLTSSYGLGFPASIMHLTLKMTQLEVEATLAALGKLPQLTILRLWDRAYMGIRWTISAGEFPQLKELYVGGLENLEEWSIERGAMPQLRKLIIQKCVKLRKVPEGLKLITTLQELHLWEMGDEFTERIKRRGEDARKEEEEVAIDGDHAMIFTRKEEEKLDLVRCSTCLTIQYK